MVLVYLMALFAFFLIALLVNKINIVAPQVVFTFGFLFQALWVIVYDDLWKLNIGDNTFIVIIAGVGIFILACSFVKKLFNMMRPLGDNNGSFELEEIRISKTKEWLYFAFLVLFAMVYLRFIVNAVGGSMTSLGGISEAIGEYDRLSKFTNQHHVVRIPSILNNVRSFVIASGYWFAYVIINNYVAVKKLRISELVILAMALVVSVLSGSRTPAFMIIIAAITYVVLIMHGSNKKDSSYSKLLGKITVVGLFLIVSFISFGTLLGRTIENNPLDYLFIYCGAEVKNLDIFLNGSAEFQSNGIWGGQTFHSLVTTFGEKIGFEGYAPYNLDIPFQNHLGHGLGNVYTTFYSYIYDFGYVGMVVLVAIMGILSQFVFEGIKVRKKDFPPSIFALAYGIICGCLVLSFFSNKFYETVLTMNFLKNILFWIVMNIVFVSKISWQGKIIKLSLFKKSVWRKNEA